MRDSMVCPNYGVRFRREPVVSDSGDWGAERRPVPITSGGKLTERVVEGWTREQIMIDGRVYVIESKRRV
jgi:hypothetical protein